MHLMKLTNLNFTSRVLLTSVPDVLFLVEEQSDRASKAGQVSQSVQVCELGLGYRLSRRDQQIFFCGKLMLVGVMNFGQIQKIMFVVVKIFWSNSNQFLVILIWSSKLASNYWLLLHFLFFKPYYMRLMERGLICVSFFHSNLM